MEKRRLLIWQTAGTSFSLAFRSIRTFPVASLFVVAALLAIRNYQIPDSLRDLTWRFRRG